MMSRQRGMATRTGINKQGWETSDFPVACDNCYGDNPYMRMLKENYGQQCRICFRPFTVFKWKGNKGIYKRTCVCSSCSKDKNICQVCTLDLQFGLPMEIRDKRCGKNGMNLLNSNFLSVQNQKVKPPPPSLPPPALTKMAEKELVFVPEQKQSDDEQYQHRVEVQGQLLKKAERQEALNDDRNPEKSSADEIKIGQVEISKQGGLLQNENSLNDDQKS